MNIKKILVGLLAITCATSIQSYTMYVANNTDREIQVELYYRTITGIKQELFYLEKGEYATFDSGINCYKDIWVRDTTKRYTAKQFSVPGKTSCHQHQLFTVSRKGQGYGFDFNYQATMNGNDFAGELEQYQFRKAA